MGALPCRFAPRWSALSLRSLVATASVIDGNGDDLNCTVQATTSHGYNWDTDNTCGFDQSTDTTTGDPALGSVADNGGPALTALPQLGSALVDEVPTSSCASVTTDERGVARPQGSACDAGAVEVSVSTPPTTAPPGGGTAPPATPVSANPALTG